MAKFKNWEFFKKARKPISRTGGPMKSKKDYDRSKRKQKDSDLIEEGLKDYKTEK